MNSNNLVPGNLFMNKDTCRCFMMVDNRSFALGGESGDVNKRAFMEIDATAHRRARPSTPGGIHFDGPPDDVVFLDASIEEQDVFRMDEVAYGALFTHEGLGEVLVKSIIRAAGNRPAPRGPYGACLCARAKDGQLVILPDGDKVVSTKVILREVPDQELVEREANYITGHSMPQERQWLATTAGPKPRGTHVFLDRWEAVRKALKASYMSPEQMTGYNAPVRVPPTSAPR